MPSPTLLNVAFNKLADEVGPRLAAASKETVAHVLFAVTVAGPTHIATNVDAEALYQLADMIQELARQRLEGDRNAAAKD